MNKSIEQAVTVFNQGGIVIFPTDTAFGIGCRVDKSEAISRLYTLRRRSITQQMSLLVDGIEMAEQYVTSIPDEVREKLMNRYWPGALTIVLPANMDVVPSLVRANGHTIGVRMPAHTDLLTIISSLGVPILGPSANFHGEKTPFVLSDVNPQLIEQVDYVFEGVCRGEQASTVIDCTVTPWQIVRQGQIVL